MTLAYKANVHLTRKVLERIQQKQLRIVRTHCPYPTFDKWSLQWEDCGCMAFGEVDGELYCEFHANVLINLE
jgi:hypothetical protein